MRTALIDGDVLVYSAGFASDGAAKRALLEQLGGDKEALAKHIEDHGLPYEPVNFALNAVKVQMNNIIERSEADDHVVFLSHPVNFREQMFPEYKANRDITHKPHWEAEIKDYLLERWGARFSAEGDEADDAMGMAQMTFMEQGYESIICTIDKDLDMIPGLHYNFNKTRRENGVYTMEDPECLRLFYKQMLTGDTADNIPGMFRKLGVKCRADTHLAPIETMDDPLEMFEYVSSIYNDDEFVMLNGKLLWIKREEKWFEAPTQKRKVKYG